MKMQKKAWTKTVIVLTITGITLAGCASPAMNENMVPQGEQLHKVIPGHQYYQSIKNSEVTGGKETNPMWTSQVSSEAFQLALNTSLKQAGLLSESGKYELKANLMELKQPLIGIGMTVEATVKYLIKDRVNGMVVFEDTIHSSFTAGMSDSMMGAARLRLANEGAIRQNIKVLLEKISK